MFSPPTLRRALLCTVLVGCSSSPEKADFEQSGPSPSTTSDAGAGDGSSGGPVRPSDGGDGNDQSADAGDAGVDEPAPEGLPFPKEFVFGTAIAGFQADMGCPTLPKSECEDPISDWFQFTTDPATVGDSNTNLTGQNPSVVGPGFWELYDEDIARAHDELHNQGLRFSLEWSRLFPTATDDAETFEEMKALANPKAVEKYHAMLASLKKRGMRPLVTLYHYALPTWIHDPVACHTDFDNCSPKGWVDAERTLREIRKYAMFCAQEFGGEVDWWATLNEPLQNMLFGYVQPNAERTHPPAVSLKTAEAKIVFNALIDAHARMYDEVKANDTVDADGDGDPSFIGVVYPLVPIEPNNPDSLFDNDDKAAENIDYLWNRVFLNAVALGQYDENIDKTNIVTRDDLVGRMDYIGVNYYFSMKVSGLGFAVPIISNLSPLFTANPLDFKQIGNQPEKLEGFLAWINDELKLPAIITENGAVDPNDDGTTPKFLVQNLAAIQKAIANGRDVRGYFYWTLMDNYEWNHGMDVRMGLYAVDKDDPTKKRVARQGVPVYGQIAKFHVLPNALLDQYGTD